MTYEESKRFSAEIGSLIAERAPRIAYTDIDVRRDRAQYTKAELSEMKELGLLRDGFETYFVIREFLNGAGISERAEGDYLLAVFRDARMLDADTFSKDPFLTSVHFSGRKKGDILLTEVAYEKGEIFQYDMPSFRERLVTPKLGFFSRRVCFPSVYHGNIPWISVCPSEINSMSPQIDAAHGNILVLGLGIGYYVFRTAMKEEVTSITVVELSQDIIDIFEETLLPQFPHPEKIHIVRGDAVTYLRETPSGKFDFCFADIWEGAVDGAPLYRAMKAEEPRLTGTEMTYWIEEQIKAYLSE